MSVKSLSVAEWCNTMVIEPVGHWWKPAAFAVLRLGCQQRLSRKNHKRRTVRLLTQQTRSSTHLCVKRRTVFLLTLWVNSYRDWTNKEKIDDCRRWNFGSEVQKQTCNYYRHRIAKDNKMKIFKIITLTYIVHYLICTVLCVHIWQI